ncbi:MAG: tetratricopeptide repeat protein, partial [Thermoanaerobaculia bacterium]
SLPEQKRLAVLAFRSAGSSDAERAFGDGLAETLSSRLTQLERFQGSFWVVPLSEVRRAGVDSAAAARRALGANLAITGSVQQVGDRLRLTANLVDATGLRQLRALSFDSPVGDLAALQDDFVRRVGEMLDLEIGGAAREVLDAGRTGDSGAYDAYLRGRGHLLDFQDPAAVEAAVADFQQALQRDADFALAYAGLGEAYWRLWELRHEPEVVELARRACLRAVQLNDLLAPVHVTLGLLDRGTGQPERALEAFDTALRLDPASAMARRERARTLEDLGRRPQAEEAYREAIRLRPGDWASHNALGRFLYVQGRIEDAAGQFRRVTEIAPDNARGWTNLGGMYQLLGRHRDARAAHERAVDLQPSPAALSNLGTLEYFLGDYPSAARTFERAVELDARSYKLWQNLAAARYWAPGQRARAPEAYRRAIELIGTALGVNPRDAMLYADRAECRAMLGEGAAARVDAERALALAPDDAQIAFRVAFVWEQLGERDQALERLAAALAGGYPSSEIEAHPGFAALRANPGYRTLVAAAGPPGEGAATQQD